MKRERRLPDDDLSRWIRALPDTWQLAEDELTPEQVNRLIKDVISSNPELRRRPKRRGRRVAVGVIVAVGLPGGAVAVRAMLHTGQPTRPSEGTVCRAEPDLHATGVVVESTSDPIGACYEVWETGEFDQYRSHEGFPELTACLAASGGVTVLPGTADVCSQLGLAALEQPLSPTNHAIVGLNERIIAEINTQPCAPSEDVLLVVERIVAEISLDGWTVQIGPGWEDAECAKAGVDAPTRTVTIFGA